MNSERQLNNHLKGDVVLLAYCNDVFARHEWVQVDLLVLISLVYDGTRLPKT